MNELWVGELKFPSTPSCGLNKRKPELVTDIIKHAEEGSHR